MYDLKRAEAGTSRLARITAVKKLEGTVAVTLFPATPDVASIRPTPGVYGMSEKWLYSGRLASSCVFSAFSTGSKVGARVLHRGTSYG